MPYTGGWVEWTENPSLAYYDAGPYSGPWPADGTESIPGPGVDSLPDDANLVGWTICTPEVLAAYGTTDPRVFIDAGYARSGGSYDGFVYFDNMDPDYTRPDGLHLYIIWEDVDFDSPPTQPSVTGASLAALVPDGWLGGTGGGGPVEETYLRLVSGSTVLSLNGVRETGFGVQVVSGVTGLGLPPKQVRWVEGAGDGAKARGRRALARDIDLPLMVVAGNRANLKAYLSDLAKMLANGCTLQWVEPDGTTWETEVEHVGGGGFIYGDDTIGQTELYTSITLRSGSPYFTSTTQVTQTLGTGTATLTVTGDAPVPPVYTITPSGTFTAVELTSGGRSWGWAGNILSGTIVVNSGTGAVTGASGANRYAGMDPGPHLFKLQPGSNSITSVRTGVSSISVSWYPKKWLVV